MEDSTQHELDALYLTQAYAGDASRHNPLCWENPWYMYYLLAFLPLFPPVATERQKVFICPQFAFSRTQITNDNKTVKSKKVLLTVYCRTHTPSSFQHTIRALSSSA